MAEVFKSLADIWEGNAAVRARTRNEGQLCTWANRNVVGIPSSAASVLSSIPLTLCADWWTDKQPSPATIPINTTLEEACCDRGGAHLSLGGSCHVKTNLAMHHHQSDQLIFMAGLLVCKGTGRFWESLIYLPTRLGKWIVMDCNVIRSIFVGAERSAEKNQRFASLG